MYVESNNKLNFKVTPQHKVLSLSNLARPKEKIEAVVDSGASDHYWPDNYRGEAHNTQIVRQP